MIRSIAKVSMFLVAMCFAVNGFSMVDCWDGPNSCGSSPACNIGQPPAGATSSPCSHNYCSGVPNSCSWDSTKHSYMVSQRTMWGWTVGGTLYTCVGSATITPTPFCCLCGNPGVLYSQ